METIKSLEARKAAFARAARHLLAEKGSQNWSTAEQATFNDLVTEADRAEALMLTINSSSNSSVARWARAHADFDSFIRVGGFLSDRRFSNTMGTVAGGQGGYTVDPLIGKDVVNVLKGYGWMRQVASQITTTSGAALSYPVSDGTAEVGERLGENIPASSLDPSFGTVPLLTTKYSSKLMTVPIELLQDTAVDLVAFLMKRATERIGRLQNLDFTVGSGIGQPAGVMTVAPVGKVAASGQPTSIIYADIVDMADSVDEACLGQPSKQADVPSMSSTGWMMSQSMRKMVRRLVDGNSRPIWLPACGNSPPMLLDYPVHINNDIASPVANAKTLAFGAFSKYLIRDALDEITFLRFDDSQFSIAGQVAFLAFARSAGNLMDSGAVRVFQQSAS